MNTFFFQLNTLLLTLYLQLATVGVSAFKPATRSELHTAVVAWTEGDTTTYGQISSWNTSLIPDMTELFKDYSDFNDDISGWDVSGVMYRMFYGASAFNQDINSWVVSSVTDMSFMFYSAYSFNQDINAWNVSSVAMMRYMFCAASAFNRDIHSWVASSVTDMSSMFCGASAFNQDINS